MRSLSLSVLVAIVVGSLLMVGCASAAPETSTAKPASATAQPPAAPTKAASLAQETGYPAKDKTITITVGQAPGGTIDTAARVLAPVMEKNLGVPVQIVNKPGASTQIASTDLAKAKPDGYNIGFISLPNLIMTYLDSERKAIYTRKDFQPIAMYALEAVTLAVQFGSPFKDAKDLASAAKANPGKLKVGTSALNGMPHLGAVAFEKMAGAEFAYVHFDGGGPAQTALLGGHVDVATVTAGAVRSHVRNGAMRLLGIMDRDENKFYPGVKTFEAQGYKACYAVGFGFAAPAGAPQEIVEVLSGAIKKSMEDEELKRRVDEIGQTLRYMGPEEFGSYWDETEREMKRLMQASPKTGKQ